MVRTEAKLGHCITVIKDGKDSSHMHKNVLESEHLNQGSA